MTSTKAGPLAAAAAFVAEGRTLFETLLLNLVPYSGGDDEPIWETPPLRLQDDHGYHTAWPRSGITRLYTWMTRGIRFLDEGSGVRRMAYGPGVQPIDTGVTERDPMVGYRLTKKGELVAVRLSIEKSLWRDFSAMLPEAAGILPATLQHASKWAQTIGRRAGVRVLGQVSDQSKLFDVRREVYPLPADLGPRVREDLRGVVELAEETGRRLDGVGWSLASTLIRSTDRNALEALRRSLPLLPTYWAVLDSTFPHTFANLGSPNALAQWRQALARAVDRAWETTRAAVGQTPTALRAIAQTDLKVAALRRRFLQP